MIQRGRPKGGRSASRDSRAALTRDRHGAAALELQGLEEIRDGRRGGLLIRRHSEHALAGNATMVAAALGGSGSRARAVPHEGEARGRRERRSAGGVINDKLSLLPRPVSLRGGRRDLPNGSGGGSHVAVIPKLG